MSLLTRSLMRYHSTVYLVGAGLMLVMAIVVAAGKTWSLPLVRRSPDVSRTDSGGVYALGVFSGAASACCAPALAGVLTLTAVTPSTATSVGIGLAYVAGMVSPLLLLTLLWDRTRLRDRVTMTSRPVTWSLAGRSLTTTTFNLAMAVVFALMAAVLVVVAVTGASLAPDAQTAAGTWLADRLAPVTSALAPVPNWVTGLVLLAGGAATVWWSSRSRSHEVRDPDPTEEEAADVHHACH